VEGNVGAAAAADVGVGVGRRSCRTQQVCRVSRLSRTLLTAAQ
jgi:hypothetical protein